MSGAYVYMLRCADGSLYTGWTVDVERRLAAHRSGAGSRYTRSRLPVELAACFEMADAGGRAPRGGADQAAPAGGEARARHGGRAHEKTGAPGVRGAG